MNNDKDIEALWDTASLRHQAASRKLTTYDGAYDTFLRFKLYKILWKHFPPGTDILEVGCGAGYNLHYLFKVGLIKSAVGIDISGKMLDIARRNLIPYKVQLLKTNFLNLNYEAPFDSIISIQSINYFSSLSVFLQHSKKHLEKNGSVIILDSQSFSDSFLNKARKNLLIRAIFRKGKLPTQPSNALIYHQISEIEKSALVEGFTIEKKLFFGHYTLKYSLDFQAWAESVEFNLKIQKVAISIVLKILFVFAYIELLLLKNYPGGCPMYIIKLRVKSEE